jgi:putative transposase
VIEMIASMRRGHPSWGPRTIRHRLLRQQPGLVLPAVSTIGAILSRLGLVVARQRRPKVERKISRPMTEATGPNARWDLDYKGDFLLGNRQRCYPLTMTDGFSRMILSIEAMKRTDYVGARRELERRFQEYGLPQVIRTDNGVPFCAQVGTYGVTRLGVWFMQLGIDHERGRPGCPQDNGQHERMHRTLKAETTRPPEQTMGAQQRRFDAFREDFNQERPHQGIKEQTPASLYIASSRSIPSRLPVPEYESHWEQRVVQPKGYIYFKNRIVYVSMGLSGFRVGLHEIDEGVWSVCFFDKNIGRYDERTGRIADRTFV